MFKDQMQQDVIMVLKFPSNSPVTHVAANTLPHLTIPAVVTVTCSRLFAVNRWHNTVGTCAGEAPPTGLSRPRGAGRGPRAGCSAGRPRGAAKARRRTSRGGLCPSPAAEGPQWPQNAWPGQASIDIR